MRRISTAVCFGCLMLAVLSSAAAQAPGRQVELSLIVTDKDHKTVTKLRREDVHVFDDNVEQTTFSIETDQRPVDLGLAIDASGSFRTILASALEAARLIIVNRRPEDEIFIERFISSDKIETAAEFNRDNDVLMEALKKFRLEQGQSAVIDGLYTTVKHVSERNAPALRRKAVVIFTDGEDRNSFYKLEELLKLLHERHVQVFAIGITLELDKDAGFTRASPRDRAEKLLKTVAEESGGRAFFPRNGKELFDSTVQVIGDLRAQFRITYQPSDSSAKKGFRKVEVKLNSADGQKLTAVVPRRYYVR